ncbi:transmembrane protein 17B [Andrena cerasifolii]|uniref:transmembrane protein 17B n=1 Tax=Andrena cerasifolii TaxID=2819439 RepID=UPI004037EC89
MQPASLLKHSTEQCTYYRKKTRPNLPFQMALYIDLWIFPVWLLITITNLEAKYESLTSVSKVVTLTAVLVLLVFESLKLYLGYLGNLGGKIAYRFQN